MADTSPKKSKRLVLVDSVSELGLIIKSRRDELGWTMVHLAEVAGSSRFFIADIESGKRTCQIDKVLDVLKALGLSFEVGQRK